MPLYGGGWGDTLACGLAIGGAAFTGAGRVLAGKHYSTDLILGLGLGGFAGWVLPRLLHYGFSDAEGLEPTSARPSTSAFPRPQLITLRLAPWLTDSQLGMSATGTF
jgi:membrane-associated phospholipid phosphatase